MERLRTATPDDRAAVSDLLDQSYRVLMAGAYPADLLAQALPLITKANPVLLAAFSAGTVFVHFGWTAVNLVVLPVLLIALLVTFRYALNVSRSRNRTA